MARYSKPVGGRQEVHGPSIRFADEAIKLFGNVDVRQDVIYEDDEMRHVQVSVTDLETNISKSTVVTVKKTVERRKPRDGQEVIGRRENSTGQVVYLVRANDDEVAMKEANLCAKARRNLELQIIPQDIIEEAMDEAVSTAQDRDAQDPDAAKRRIIDAFARIGVRPTDLEQYLDHSLGTVSPAEIDDLRQVYQAIHQGEASWKDYVSHPDEQNGNGGPSEKAKAVRERVSRTREKRQAPSGPTSDEKAEADKRRAEQKARLQAEPDEQAEDEPESDAEETPALEVPEEACAEGWRMSERQKARSLCYQKWQLSP